MIRAVCTIFLCTSILISESFSQTPSHIVICEVYAGGGNSGAPFQNDYVVLFNPTSTVAILAGWSVQYASTMGEVWTSTPLSGTIAANSYYLVQEASGGLTGAILPPSDVSGIINMSATAGKLVLCNSNVMLLGLCPVSASIVDLVGYGPTTGCFEGTNAASTPGNVMALVRKDGGCTDTDDNNMDFDISAPQPKNSASESALCIPSSVFEDELMVGGMVKHIEVYDILGCKVFDAESTVAPQHCVGALILQTGVYIIRVSNSNGVHQMLFAK